MNRGVAVFSFTASLPRVFIFNYYSCLRVFNYYVVREKGNWIRSSVNCAFKRKTETPARCRSDIPGGKRNKLRFGFHWDETVCQLVVANDRADFEICTDRMTRTMLNNNCIWIGKKQHSLNARTITIFFLNILNIYIGVILYAGRRVDINHVITNPLIRLRKIDSNLNLVDVSKNFYFGFRNAL